MPTSQLLYCDESGQRDYGKKTDRFFVVAGVVVDSADASHLEDEIRGLKRAFWGDPDVEIKSNWIRQPKERQKHYAEPLGIGLPEIDALMSALVKWLMRAPVTFLAGVVDKPAMQTKYEKPHYAGAVAYTLLMQRYQKRLENDECAGNVIFDDPAGKSTGGFEWRTLLQRQHATLKKHGCPYTKMQFPDVGALSFADSAAATFVQIADLLAYNTFRQFREHGEQYDAPAAKTLSLYKPFGDMLPAFDTGPARVFAGYGVAHWPTRAKNRWIAPER